MKSSAFTGLVLLALLAGCSSGASVDDLRQVAADAGDSPTDCPYDLDLSDAVGADAVVGQVDAEVSQSATPASDPLRAQQDGMSVLEAAAASYVSCTYAVGADSLTVHVVTTPGAGDAAAVVLLPQLQQDAALDTTQLQSLVDGLADPGTATLAPGGDAALELVPVDGDGSAAVLVTGDAVSGDDLAAATEKLVDDLAQR